MTALVDVGFLLLTFFMLTTQFRPPEPIPIILPSSNAEVRLPATNILMITISDAGQVFLGEEGKEELVEVPMTDLGEALIQYRVQNPQLRTVIKADRNAAYGPIEDAMEQMKDAQINRFSLITDLEAGPRDDS